MGYVIGQEEDHPKQQQKETGASQSLLIRAQWRSEHLGEGGAKVFTCTHVQVPDGGPLELKWDDQR